MAPGMTGFARSGFTIFQSKRPVCTTDEWRDFGSERLRIVGFSDAPSGDDLLISRSRHQRPTRPDEKPSIELNGRSKGCP
jgi:hypothetical protein